MSKAIRDKLIKQAYKAAVKGHNGLDREPTRYELHMAVLCHQYTPDGNICQACEIFNSACFRVGSDGWTEEDTAAEATYLQRTAHAIFA